LTFMVDLDPEQGLERTRTRGEEATRFERQPGAFHHALRQAFLEIANAEPDRCVILDGSQSPDIVFERAMMVIQDRLEVPA
jgi:dTMP kinase